MEIKDSTLLFAAEPFVTTKTVDTGMGLTMVKMIIKDHGGTLKIQQRISGGNRSLSENRNFFSGQGIFKKIAQPYK